jgi:hypothetical protein
MSAIGQTGTVPASPSATPEVTPPSTGQAAQPGTEQETQTPRATGFWGRFPTVPEDQRAALEPHLKTVQGYITRLEQAYVAPFKGYNPQQVAGVAQFAKAFDTQPLNTFLALAEDLQKRGIIHEDLDLQMLAAVVNGQDIPDDEVGGAPGEQLPVDDGQGDPWESAPPWAQEIRGWREQQEQQQQEQQRTVQEQKEDAVLDAQLKSIKSQLANAGFPKEYLEREGLEKDLIARFIVHGGSMQNVLKEMVELRTTLLQGLVKEDEPVDLRNGVPGNGRSATQRRADRNKGDSFAQASAAAEQHLRSANRNQ